MLEDRVVYTNGKFVAWKDSTVHMMSHSFARGTTIFEVLSLHATDDGPAVFRLQDHIARLTRSAHLLDMDLPMSPDAFYEAVIETVKRNNLDKGIIKIMGYYPQIALDILPPDGNLEFSIFAMDPEQDIPGIDFSERSTTIGISSWHKLDPKTVPVEAKAAANYLNGMVARLDVRKRGFDYALMLDSDGFIAEGGTESVFIVRDGRLMTSALGTVLHGITRKSILQAAESLDIITFEGRLSPDILFEAEEIFLSSSLSKILPVHKIEDRELPEAPGLMGIKLAELMDKITVGKEAHFKDWLYPIK